MISLEEVTAEAEKRFAAAFPNDVDDLSVDVDFQRVAFTFAALVDEFNAELERVAGAILERVGARDLRVPDDVRAIVAEKPADLCAECGRSKSTHYLGYCRDRAHP